MSPDKPSNTALIVAAGMQLVRHRAAYAHLIPHEAMRRGAAVLSAATPTMSALLRNAAFRGLCRLLERATLPGILLHYALRKQRLRRMARQAMASGCTQVVVIGAGLDTLSMELKADYPHVRCIELDHPATQAKKRAACGADAAAIHFVSADLAKQTLTEALDSCAAFQRATPTLYVAEGLMMYLPVQAVAQLFARMKQLTPDCQVAFTWFEPQRDGAPNFSKRSRLVDLWLRLRSEPFLSAQPRAGLGAFLSEIGFHLKSVSESIDLLPAQVRDSLPAADLPITGEYICHASANAAYANLIARLNQVG